MPLSFYPISLCLVSSTTQKRTAPRGCSFISEPTLHRSIIRLSYAFLAISTNFANAAASCTAKSANILRLISTPAFVKPAMKRL